MLEANMYEQRFKELYQGTWEHDPEYEMYYKLWVEYRKRTDWMPQSMGKKAWKIHQSLFCDMPKNQNYIKAKEASLRAHFY
jgi:hypothetical protein